VVELSIGEWDQWINWQSSLIDQWPLYNHVSQCDVYS